ncbi:MAG: phage portal protein [Gemmataceae bacterium]|nr:phage portal protein [Gemmataceae bacterium]
MGFFDRLFGDKAKPNTPAITAKRDITYQQGFDAGLVPLPTSSGVTVDERTALGLPPLWAGIRIISADVGSLEPVLYREQANGQREPAVNHPVYRLLCDEPNPEQTRPVVFETLMFFALLHGAAFAEIVRDGAGRPQALWPIHPRNVRIGRDANGELVYQVTITLADGMPGEAGRQITLSKEDILCVPGLSADGTGVAYSLLRIARETLGFGVATQRYGAGFFANAARPGGVLEAQGQLNDNAKENLRRSWQSLHSGTDNVGKVAILEEGLKFTPFTFSNEQNQYKDVLDWYGYQVAQLLCIPPTKIGVLGRATWSNIDALSQDYLTTTLRPWLEKFEAEFEKKLLTPTERNQGYYVEYDTTALLRADISSRSAFYSSAINTGWMTTNEVRARENLPPVEGGDVLRVPLNTGPMTSNPEPAKVAA